MFNVNEMFHSSGAFYLTEGIKCEGSDHICFNFENLCIFDIVHKYIKMHSAAAVQACLHGRIKCNNRFKEICINNPHLSDQV